jgi:putative transposase
LVLEVRSKLPRIGTRKLHYLLKERLAHRAIKLGRDGLFAYLREQQLLITPKKRYTKTTHSKHWLRKHPNLYTGMSLRRPEQAFVSDITYVESSEGVHYLSLVTDAYSRKIMGHALSRDMKTKHMNKALRSALRNRQTQKPLIHHSDRGLQYCSGEYQQTLKAHKIKPSMTDGYDCYQNALAERVNGILKGEFLLTRCNTFEDLDRVVTESIQLYNQLRPHLSLGMKTPEQVHKEKAGCL